MFSLGAILRKRKSEGYPADLPDKIVAALGEKHVSAQELRRRLFGLDRLTPAQDESMRRALHDLEAAGRIRRFGRGHGATFYEFTFYENVAPDVEAW